MVKYDSDGKPVAEYAGQQRFFDDIPITISKRKQRKGGSGSGNFGHEGRPGEGVGGSGAGGGGAPKEDRLPEGPFRIEAISPREMAELEKGTGTHLNSSLADSASIHYNEKLTSEEHMVVSAYTGGAYSRWNDALRDVDGAPPIDAQQTGYIDTLTRVVDSAPKYEGTTYRGINGAWSAEVYDTYANLKVGDTYTDKGFVSASLSEYVHQTGQLWTKEREGKAVRMTIDGKNGYVLANAAQNSAEREVLYNRNTTFEVTNHEILPDGSVKIGVKEL